jgi:hypothetical protein
MFMGALAAALVATTSASAYEASRSTQMDVSRHVLASNDSGAQAVQVALSAAPISPRATAGTLPLRAALGGFGPAAAAKEGPAVTSEPDDWVLVLVGAFLIAAISYRRVSTLEA